MTHDHAVAADDMAKLLRDQAEDGNAATENGAPPPPPRPPGLAPPSARTDFTASAAMVNDILSVAPDDDRAEDPPGAPETTDGKEVETPASTAIPLASDFFTTAKRKKRFRHSK